MDVNANSINWFEIPVTDMQRAKHFYQVIFSMHMHEQEMQDVHMAFFPFAPGNGKISGCLAKSEHHKPGMEGPVIYLNANPDLSSVLDKVEAEGGKILLPKTHINPETGNFAYIMDTEGNRIGLHSQG